MREGVPHRASHVAEDGSIQIDKEKCIGCQFCVMACPYGVRYLNEEEKVVEKCTLCEQKLSQGELPQCVSQCGGNAATSATPRPATSRSRVPKTRWATVARCSTSSSLHRRDVHRLPTWATSLVLLHPTRPSLGRR